MERLDEIKSYYHTLATKITEASQKYLLIEYNKDILNKSNLNNTLLKLQQFIGVTPLDLVSLYNNNKKYPVLKKQSYVKHASEHISNWDSLSSEVRRYADNSLDFNALFMN